MVDTEVLRSWAKMAEIPSELYEECIHRDELMTEDAGHVAYDGGERVVGFFNRSGRDLVVWLCVTQKQMLVVVNGHRINADFLDLGDSGFLQDEIEDRFTEDQVAALLPVLATFGDALAEDPYRPRWTQLKMN
ncbi:MAG: hypothetical protein K0U16_07740 [Gammaproteobacteria bacterium]|nr:hypothetical protein [Gammaproteobacteria bacterium]